MDNQTLMKDTQFMDPLEITPLGNPTGGFTIFGYRFFGTTDWKLLKDFTYESDSFGGGMIHIKAGFTTDLASIPRVFWNIYPPYSPEYGKAAVLHDVLYASESFDRATDDGFMYEGMGLLGCDPVSKRIIYSAVRTFGGAVWKNHTKGSIAEAKKFVEITGFPLYVAPKK